MEVCKNLHHQILLLQALMLRVRRKAQMYLSSTAKVSKSVSLTYSLKPKKQGDLVIPAATATVNGGEMRSRSPFL
jgi:hypothetical protein